MTTVTKPIFKEGVDDVSEIKSVCCGCGVVFDLRPSAPAAVAAAKGLSKAFQHVAEVAAPSIVSLEVRVKPGLGWTWWQGGSAVNDPLSNANRGADWIRRPIPQVDSSRPTHVGSGFLIDNRGTILTAFHVVEHAEEIHVRTHEGHEFLATAILTDFSLGPQAAAMKATAAMAATRRKVISCLLNRNC